MTISIRKCVSCLLSVMFVLVQLNLSVKAATYLDKSVFEAGENHFVYLCPDDTNNIIINWQSEFFAALNFQKKWALYDFYGTQLTDYIYDGFYDVSYAPLYAGFSGMVNAHFTDENIKGYIGNKDYILTRDKYGIISTLTGESESHNPDYPEPTPSADVTDQIVSNLFDNITPSEEMPFTAAYALKDFVLVEYEDINKTFVYGILSYAEDIVLPMKYKTKDSGFLFALEYKLFLQSFPVSENRYVVFSAGNQELADVPLIPVSDDGMYYGYAGKDGLTIPCKYTNAAYFNDGLAVVAIGRVYFDGYQDNNFYDPPENERMIGYIDTSGNTVHEFYMNEVSDLSAFHDGLAQFVSSECTNPASLLCSPSRYFYMDKMYRVVIKQPFGYEHNPWLNASGFRNGIAVVSGRFDVKYGQGMWVIRYTEGKDVEESKFLSRSDYLNKYAGYPGGENIMRVIGTGIYKGQEILAITDFPPNSEQLFFRLLID